MILYHALSIAHLQISKWKVITIYKSDNNHHLDLHKELYCFECNQHSYQSSFISFPLFHILEWMHVLKWHIMSGGILAQFDRTTYPD